MLFSKYRNRIKMMFSKEKIMNFLDKQGFYIVLFICISIIGVTAFLTSNREGDSQDGVGGDIPPLEETADDGDLLSDASGEDGRNLDEIDIKVKDVITEDNKGQDEEQDKEQMAEGSQSSSSSENSAQDAEDKLAQTDKQNHGDTQQNIESNKDNKANGDEGNSNDTDVKPVVSQQKAAKFTMIYPVEGEVLRQYSMDELVYSNTLKEWTTHPGIDIESFLGAEVKAAMDGVVEKIEEDPLMGITITIDHGEGIKTIYANLSTANMVTEGQKIKAGQIISGVGRTAGKEILDAPHLHFELNIDGKPVNPDEYFK